MLHWLLSSSAGSTLSSEPKVDMPVGVAKPGNAGSGLSVDFAFLPYFASQKFSLRATSTSRYLDALTLNTNVHTWSVFNSCTWYSVCLKSARVAGWFSYPKLKPVLRLFLASVMIHARVLDRNFLHLTA